MSVPTNPRSSSPDVVRFGREYSFEEAGPWCGQWRSGRRFDPGQTQNARARRLGADGIIVSVRQSPGPNLSGSVPCARCSDGRRARDFPEYLDRHAVGRECAPHGKARMGDEGNRGGSIHIGILPGQKWPCAKLSPSGRAMSHQPDAGLGLEDGNNIHSMHIGFIFG